MEAPKKDSRFSSAWTDKNGKPKEGVKIRDLRSKPKYTPLRDAEPKSESPLYKKGSN